MVRGLGLTARHAGAVVALVVWPLLVGTAPSLGATSPDDTDGIVVTGRIVRAGAPISGADVVIRVWPNEVVLGALPDGADFELQTAAETKTDADGDYAASLAFDLPAGYTAPDGRVDLEVIASDGTYAATQALTAQGITRDDPSSPGDRPMRAWVRAGASKEDAPARVDFDLAPATAARLRAEATQGERGDAAPATPGVSPAAALLGAAARAPAAVSPSAGGCSSSTGNRHGPYMEKYADIWGTAGAKGRVVHERNTSHTLGIGVKYSGSSSWSAGGTQAKHAGFGYDSNYTVADAAVYNKVYHRYYYYVCMADGRTYRTTYTKPDAFYSGPLYSYSRHVDFSHCAPTYADHEYHRYQGANGTYDAGVDLPFINLSAQSGWSSTTEMHWKFTRAGRLCGSTSRGWAYAPRVSARA